MKTKLNLTRWLLLAAFLFTTLHQADAWYSPSQQRWINRDLAGDETTYFRQPTRTNRFEQGLLRNESLGNLYSFTHNSPVGIVDTDGRAIAIAIPIAGGITIGEGIAIGAGICLLIPACRDNLLQLANEALRGIRDLCRAIVRPRPTPPDCKLTAATATLCLYTCSSPVGPYVGAIPKPAGGCPEGAKHEDVTPMPGRDYPGFPPKPIE